jgi:hypothetical protein
MNFNEKRFCGSSRTGESIRFAKGSAEYWLGTLPITYPVHKDGLVVFAGQRWIVKDLDERTKTLVVAPHPGGVVPRFERSGGEPAHDRLIEEMLSRGRRSVLPRRQSSGAVGRGQGDVPSTTARAAVPGP